MASMEGYLQALSLVAILILAPMTIHLLVHKEDNTVFVFVETNNDEQQDGVENETEAREIPQLNRSEVARIATFNIKVFGETKMSKQHLGHTARKRFGQNFLHDPYIIDQIVNKCVLLSPSATINQSNQHIQHMIMKSKKYKNDRIHEI